MQELFLLLLLASICNGIKYDGLKVKFGWESDTEGKDYFFTVERTIQDAVAAGYRLTDRPNGPLMELKMYCAPKRIVCPLYHTGGFVAGMQIAIPVDSLNPDLKPERYLVKWNAPAAGEEPAAEFWTATQFYVSEDFLKAGGPTVANGSTLQDTGVWINDLDGKLLKVDLTEAGIAATPPFKRQNCVINMGTHYYYNMTKELECIKFVLPWFGLVTKGETLGVGFQTFGKAPTVPEKQRKWFEDIPLQRNVPLMTTPHAPECYLDLFMKYGGLVSIHIYYISKPWELRCEPADSVEPWLAAGGANAHCQDPVKSGQRHPKNSLRINILTALFHYLLW